MLYFRLPNNEKYYTTDQNSANTCINFVSFDSKKELGFKGNIVEVSTEVIANENFLPKSKKERIELYKDTAESYSKKVEQAIDFIKNKNLRKLVISRGKILMYSDLSIDKKLALGKSFLKFSENYHNAFCYLFEKDGHCWMGGFSEVLGKYNKNTNAFETMSLAATLPINEEWTDKEIEEQKPVTDYIHSILKRFAVDISVSKVKDHYSGNIKHLRTDFNATVYPQDLENLIKELHPTPAVCGFPKDICMQGIKIIEFNNREFYAGYIRVETEDEIQFFVNLRCAEFFKSYALLHVGGGITEKSDAKKEWIETELKSMAVQNNLIFE